MRVWTWKYQARRWLLRMGQRLDRDWTERVAFDLGWLESRDRERWFMRLDERDRRRV